MSLLDQVCECVEVGVCIWCPGFVRRGIIGITPPAHLHHDGINASCAGICYQLIAFRAGFETRMPCIYPKCTQFRCLGIPDRFKCDTKCPD